MSRVAVLGAGAFGTALAIALASPGRQVTLWARAGAADMDGARENRHRLPGHSFPEALRVTASLPEAAEADILLLAVPMQALSRFVSENASLFWGKTLVACCKGIDLSSGRGPQEVLASAAPDAQAALLSGPSFATDIAAGLPTALTLAMADDRHGAAVQRQLSVPTLRLYRSTDLTGVAIGGALKNVFAIGCGVTIGAGLGESARAALMTRGYAEMQRHALARGAQAETLAGLSGFGDLALTCTSEKSRNYRFGLALGRSGNSDPQETTEGIATARALGRHAAQDEMPVSAMVVALLEGRVSVEQAMEGLLSRPLKAE